MIRWTLASLVFFSVAAQAFEAPLRPNPEVTQGDFCTPQDKDFESYRYKEQIPTCYRVVSRVRKAAVYDLYGVPTACREQYTIDHYVPLSLGGSNQPTNLWPEHKDVKATRQNLEQDLYDRIKAGTISQRQALEVLLHAKMNPPAVDPRHCLADFDGAATE